MAKQQPTVDLYLGNWIARTYKQFMTESGGGLELTCKHAPDEIIGEYPLTPEAEDLEETISNILNDAEQDARAHGPGLWTYYVRATVDGEPDPVARFSFPIERRGEDSMMAMQSHLAPPSETQVQTAQRHLENIMKVNLAGDVTKNEGWSQLTAAQAHAIETYQTLQATYLRTINEAADRRQEIEEQRAFEASESDKNRQLGSKFAKLLELAMMAHVASKNSGD